MVVPDSRLSLLNRSKRSATTSGRQSERRLVEQQQPGTRHQRTSDCEHLLLATRQTTGELRAALPEDRVRLVPGLEIGFDLAVAARVGTGTQIVLDAELGKRPPALGHMRDSSPHDVGRVSADDLVAEEPHRALGLDHAGDRPQRGGLSRAVRAEDDHDLALVDTQVHAAQHGDGPVARDHAGDVEQAHRRTLGTCWWPGAATAAFMTRLLRRGRPRSPGDLAGLLPGCLRRSWIRSPTPPPCRRCPSPSPCGVPRAEA